MPTTLQPSSSSLDPLETSAQLRPPRAAAWTHPAENADRPQRGPHLRSWAVRARTITALRLEGDPQLSKRAARMCECCAVPTIRKRADGSPLLSLGRCRDRLCPLCGWYRGTECTRRTAELIRRMNAPRFLTLTLRETTAGLSVALDRLFQCFRELRRRKEWRAHVTGGLYAFEATFRLDRSTWHAHLHLIIDGRFFPQPTIKALWHAVTGDSSIVHIEAVHDAQAQARYLARYINTPADLSHWPVEAIAEYADAVHGRRLLHTFGNLHGANPDAADDPEPVGGSSHLVAVSALKARSALGCPYASEALELMRRMGGLWAVFSPTLPLGPSTSCVPFEAWERTKLVELIEASNRAADEPTPQTAPTPPPRDCGALLFDVGPPDPGRHL